MSPSLEIAVRIGGAALVFTAMALWEWLAPRRALTVGRRPRWPGNLGILAVGIVTVRLLVPTAAVGVALIASDRGWGLLNLIGLPSWMAIVIGVIESVMARLRMNHIPYLLVSALLFCGFGFILLVRYYQ